MGKQIQFRVDSKSQSGQQREFVTILLPSGDANLAVELVAQGLARVSARKEDESNLPEGLSNAEATAQAEGKGIWSKDAKVLAEVCVCLGGVPWS